MRWDPERYLEFAAERARPFGDLLARVAPGQPRLVVDLGCGPGNLTAELATRWPDARVHGLDSSPEMVRRAVAEHGGAAPGRLSFEVGDLRQWRASEPVDVVVCNATLQWVPDHLDLLPLLLDQVAPDGWLAVQVPGNFADPSHTALAQIAASPRWAAAFAGRGFDRAWAAPPVAYLETLAGLGCTVDAWETTYLHVLSGADAVLRWMEGTGLRPYLEALDDDADRAELRADYRELLVAAYPRRAWGTVLPFRRIFAVARRRSA